MGRHSGNCARWLWALVPATVMVYIAMTAAISIAQSSSSNPAPDTARSNLVVALGDSVTAGFGAPAGKSYPDFLEGDLFDSGYPYRVMNLGQDGGTTAYGVQSLPAIEKRTPALVVVIFGANDKLGNITISQTTADLDLIVSSLQANGSKVIVGEQTLSQDYGAEYIRQFHAMFAALAQRYGIPLDTGLYRDIANVPGVLQADGVHPTADGYAQLARNLLPLVRAQLIKHPRKKRHRH